MAQSKSMFERYLEAVEKTADITLQWNYQKQMMYQELVYRKQLIEEVVQEVLSRIHMTADATQLVEEIDEVKKALKELEKMCK